MHYILLLEVPINALNLVAGTTQPLKAVATQFLTTKSLTTTTDPTLFVTGQPSRFPSSSTTTSKFLPLPHQMQLPPLLLKPQPLHHRSSFQLSSPFPLHLPLLLRLPSPLTIPSSFSSIYNFYLFKIGVLLGRSYLELIIR